MKRSILRLCIEKTGTAFKCLFHLVILLKHKIDMVISSYLWSLWCACVHSVTPTLCFFKYFMSSNVVSYSLSELVLKKTKISMLFSILSLRGVIMYQSIWVQLHSAKPSRHMICTQEWMYVLKL